MLYYAAPMEGITTYIYRRAHAHWYGGIDKYFTPFIAGKKMTSREIRDILPENNDGVPLVPQILTNRADDFLSIAERIAAYGYDTVNLNLGCPSGTVTAKKRGAGFLSEPDALDAFLCEIYEKCPLKISIKTRLGVSELKEWDRLVEIYAKYPVQELIVHARLLQEFYTGKTHPEAYACAKELLDSVGIPLCYNGDITSAESLQSVREQLFQYDTSVTSIADYSLNCVMVGRGLIRNPALIQQLQAGKAQYICHSHSHDGDSKETLRAFHDEILDGYRQIMSGDLPVLFKMKDLWTYMIAGFANFDSLEITPKDIDKHLKKIRKANRLSEYKTAVDNLFREYYTPR